MDLVKGEFRESMLYVSPLGAARAKPKIGTV
jgi:hypothetical protein